MTARRRDGAPSLRAQWHPRITQDHPGTRSQRRPGPCGLRSVDGSDRELAGHPRTGGRGLVSRTVSRLWHPARARLLWDYIDGGPTITINRDLRPLIRRLGAG